MWKAVCSQNHENFVAGPFQSYEECQQFILTQIAADPLQIWLPVEIKEDQETQCDSKIGFLATDHENKFLADLKGDPRFFSTMLEAEDSGGMKIYQVVRIR